MSTRSEYQLNEIRSRLVGYNKHRNDPYNFHPGEIPAVLEFSNNAPTDIEFLLKEVELLKKLLRRALFPATS